MMDPHVCEAMLPYLRDQYANPSSIHHFGQRIRYAVETAREQVASALGVKPREIVFTSGGTEANNMAIRGVLAAQPDKRHFVTTQVEHDSVLRLAQQLQREGYRVTYLNVDKRGRLDLDEFESSLTEDTALASVMSANNETGVIFPIEKLGEIAANRGVPFHVDATQTVGKLPLQVGQSPIELLTLAAHKFHGPKGIGALYVKRGVHIRRFVWGGHQERDLRTGTENVAGIVGMAEALQLAVEHWDEGSQHIRGLRDRLEQGIVDRVGGVCATAVHINGDRDSRLPNTSNVSFEALEAEAILMLLSNEGVCASSGSACSSGSLEPSHVLAAMGFDERVVHGAIRFSLSQWTTEDEIDRVLDIMSKVIRRLETLHIHS